LKFFEESATKSGKSSGDAFDSDTAKVKKRSKQKTSTYQEFESSGIELVCSFVHSSLAHSLSLSLSLSPSLSFSFASHATYDGYLLLFHMANYVGSGHTW
jgi:hypothetical protein